MGNAERVDVFISYTGRDWGWASWLDFILRGAGYTTKVQGYDFMVGKSFVNTMNEALKQSRLVACLLSPAYLDSRWCGEEWQAALVKEKLLPLRIAECDLDGLLAPRTYLDLVGVPEAEARERIVAELKKRDGEDPRPKVKPAFPCSAAVAPGPRFPGSLPAIWNITEERNPYFTDRDQALAELHQALTAGQTAALTQAIKGLGGVGKSQLALEYAFRHVGEYDGIWWLHAEEPTTLARDYVDLAPKLGVPVVTDEGQMVRQVREQLSQRQRILLIFDNATEPSALAPYLPVHAARQIIVPTRAQTWPDSVAQDVHELPLDAAIAFLQKRTGQADQAAATDVAQRLGCLPLALEQAAAYVMQCQKKLAGGSSLPGSSLARPELHSNRLELRGAKLMRREKLRFGPFPGRSRPATCPGQNPPAVLATARRPTVGSFTTTLPKVVRSAASPV